MSERNKSQRGFVAVTLITVLAIALVLVVYASLLGTFTGGEVTVGTIDAKVWYSKTNGTDNTLWKANLYNLSKTADYLFSKINVTGGYEGPVKITWKLQKQDGTWANVSTYGPITVTLSGTSGENVYASPTGTSTNGNHDWMGDISDNGKYLVKVWIESTG